MSPDEQPGNSKTPGAELCLSCGLCCRGVWFTEVTLSDAEADKASEMGLKVDVKEGRRRFLQPCSKHDGTGCTIYQTWRPTPCVKYRCAVLEQLETGALPMSEALQRVKVARAMADRLVSAVGNHPEGLLGQAFSEALEQSRSGPNGLSPQEWQEAMLDTVTLNVLYEKHFKR